MAELVRFVGHPANGCDCRHSTYGKCDECGASEYEDLPPGSLIVSPEQVEQIKAKRDEANDLYCTPPSESGLTAFQGASLAGAIEAYNDVLSILGVDDRKAER